VIDSRDCHEAVPAQHNGTAVLLLAGSSGRVESARADLLAASGAHVRAIRWFGGVGQRPVPHEVPLELFTEQIDLLRRSNDRVIFFGTSFGAEAALATASRYPVDGVIAVAPTSVVWEGVDGESRSSHWTFGGAPVPYVPFDRGWVPDNDPPAYRSLYERSVLRDLAVSEAVRIRVEHIAADVLLIAGGDDQVWSSVLFADEIERVRSLHELTTTVVSHPRAGHRLLLPGEEPVAGGAAMRRGGSPQADAELGARGWNEVLRLLSPAR